MLINSPFFLLISFLIIITYQTPLNQKDFQLELDGKKTDLYFLTNENGAEISITNYGGIIVSIMVPNKKNEYDNIVQGYSTLYEYLIAQKKGIKMNSLLGRYSNVIENDEFTLDNKNYKLTKSSYSDFGEKVWTPVQINERELRLFYTSEDGENGFPGKLHIEIIYTLTNNNELIISYTGITTKKTVINLSLSAKYNINDRYYSYIKTVIDSITEKGGIVVASSGNREEKLEKGDDQRIPCEFDNVICVSGLDTNSVTSNTFKAYYLLEDEDKFKIGLDFKIPSINTIQK